MPYEQTQYGASPNEKRIRDNRLFSELYLRPQWLAGEGPPADSLGEDGMMYTDTLASAHYGPKASGMWGEPRYLKGDRGDPGSSISTGDGPPSDAGLAGDLYVDSAAGEGNGDLYRYDGSSWVLQGNIRGEKGNPGLDGDDGDDGRGFTPRGEWVSGTSYAVDDIATHEGSVYRRTVAGTGTTPPPDDGANWSLWAGKGETGEPGAGVPSGGADGDYIRRTSAGSTVWEDPAERFPESDTSGAQGGHVLTFDSGSGLWLPKAAQGMTQAQSDKLDALRPNDSYCELSRGSQVIPTNSWTPIIFDDSSYEAADPRNWHSISTNPERITPGEAGYYTFWAKMLWEINHSGARQIRILRSNGANFGPVVTSASAAPDAPGTVPGLGYVPAGGYIHIEVWQNSGSNLTVRQPSISVVRCM